MSAIRSDGALLFQEQKGIPVSMQVMIDQQYIGLMAAVLAVANPGVSERGLVEKAIKLSATTISVLETGAFPKILAETRGKMGA